MIGIDIIKVDRIQAMIERFGQKALLRFLHESEIKQATSIQSIAGYWAAKEAIAKALQTGIGSKLSFKDITIYKIDGAPYFRLSQEKEQAFGIIQKALSITHEKDYAIAVAVVIRSSPTCKS